MSHISKIEIKIQDIDTLKKACDRLGFSFRENQNCFLRYNGSSDCDHAIQVPGARYEIGLKGTELLFDNYYQGGLNNNIPGKIKQAYAVERVKQEAKTRRLRVIEKTTQTGIQLTLHA